MTPHNWPTSKPRSRSAKPNAKPSKIRSGTIGVIAMVVGMSGFALVTASIGRFLVRASR